MIKVCTNAFFCTPPTAVVLTRKCIAITSEVDYYFNNSLLKQLAFRKVSRYFHGHSYSHIISFPNVLTILDMLKSPMATIAQESNIFNVQMETQDQVT